MIKVTVIIKDVTDAFFEGMGDSIIGLLNMTDADKFTYLNKQLARFPMKISSGSFRDRVELNSMIKKSHTITFKLEPRRGYKLATFTFSTTTGA